MMGWNLTRIAEATNWRNATGKIQFQIQGWGFSGLS